MTNDGARLPFGDRPRPDWVHSIGGSGRAMLEALLRSGGVVQADLTRRLDLSQPSVARLVGGFAAESMIRISARAATGRGNPSAMLRLEPDHAFGLGVAIVGDALSMAIVDFAGRVRGTRRVAVADRRRTVIVAQLGAMRDDLVSASGIDPGRLVGAGLGFSGFFVDAPLRFNPPPMLADWADADLPALLGPALRLPVLCDNDATTAAIAESLLGVGRDGSSFAYCHLNNGFGGALIVDGRPMRGVLGNAGDFGGVWWLLDQGYPSLDRLRVLVEDGGAAFGTVETMLAAIDAETPGVEAWLAEAERPFASLAFLLGHIVAPAKVVIGGRLPGWLAERLAARIVLPRTPVRHDRPFPLPDIVARQVDGDAAAIGAALMPLQAVFFA